ncbi:hypothetical protein RclHR1_03270009 [Rhizophagus clarus]|uniref:F-box domain-containing protein n=1 Tax=Rhizophagus clarus TaxID=94130 RepID=A0A2Z6S2Q8_9GLOM|nr:hypothetical protein RclHR1_03270009 [Rhizophagus clarus]GES74731.1 hypothetical protein GLOIN_2v1783316 [Rhizophagus clarus]
MSNLNRDILYLIYEQLQDNKKALYSCLLVNKTWCEMIIPILWKNPWECLKKENEIMLLRVIISHLSNVSRNKIGEHKILNKIYQNLSFNYISYCRHLNLDEIQRIINENIKEKSIILNVQNEILNLFINENTKFTHLYMCKNFDHQIHHFHGAERCFSEIEFLSCSTGMNDNILTKLTETCKLIKELKLCFELENNNYGIVKLIEAQRKLINIELNRNTYDNETYCKIIEESMIKHASTIRYCKIVRRPSTQFLSSFINLKELELGCNVQIITSWKYLENLSFPFLQILKSSSVPIEVITSLIKNTSGNLIEIKIDYVGHDEIGNEKLLQTIYQKCPNIKYLKLLIRNSNILELEKLLINCHHLNGLYLLISIHQDREFDWDKFFETLTKSSPTSLFKFKFLFNSIPKLEFFKVFFDNWKGRHPMFLQVLSNNAMDLKLIEKYKSDGKIKKFNYNHRWYQRTKDFEWV